jgi:hypothetical protein
MYSGGLEPTVNRIALREASRYNTKDQVADGNAQRSVIVLGQRRDRTVARCEGTKWAQKGHKTRVLLGFTGLSTVLHGG